MVCSMYLNRLVYCPILISKTACLLRMELCECYLLFFILLLIEAIHIWAEIDTRRVDYFTNTYTCTALNR